MMFLLKCKHCGNAMKYQPKSIISDKSKRCVYCGKSFKIKSAILKKISD